MTKPLEDTLGEIVGQLVGAQAVCTAGIYANLIGHGVISRENGVESLRSTAESLMVIPDRPVCVQIGEGLRYLADVLERGEELPPHPFKLIHGGIKD